ncbi:N-acetyltransferase-like protein [Parathielavia appendiculata]|uniref:N-acetyltransferase-like protein n=1 Tax=Parathielavia appendiculata TaxID=2587402 RepID=A0AAN6U9Z8_9PEZI|nr:N-acetyltransferase-like protein [Parathielavia appendiculata]
MPSNPCIRVREATRDDIGAIVDINFTAFDDNVMNRLMYPGGVTADVKAKYASKLFPQDNAGTPANEGQTVLCVAEYLPEPTDGPGEIVAFARWLLQREPRTEAGWKAKEFNATTETWGEGCDVAVVNAFIGEMTRIQRDHAQGEAALYLSLLACSPTRQRLGAGSALLKWGVDLADSLGLPSRVEASPAGYRLYKKFGYEDVDVLDLKVTDTWGVVNTDGSDWGANNAVSLAGPAPDGVVRSVIMRRPPRKAAI